MPRTAARGKLSLEFHGAERRVALPPTLQPSGHSWEQDLPHKDFTSVEVGSEQGCSLLLFLQFFARQDEDFQCIRCHFLNHAFWGVFLLYCFYKCGICLLLQMSGRERIRQIETVFLLQTGYCPLLHCDLNTEVFYDTVAFLSDLTEKKDCAVVPFEYQFGKLKLPGGQGGIMELSRGCAPLPQCS